jgi:hypothetical protein
MLYVGFSEYLQDSFKRIAFFVVGIILLCMGAGFGFSSPTIGVIVAILGFIVMGYSFKSGSIV